MGLSAMTNGTRTTGGPRTHIPHCEVVEDSPRRLVLQAGMARVIPAVILLVFGLGFVGVWWLERRWWWALLVAALFASGAVFFLLHRPRWTFDAARGVVRFESPLRRGWEAPLASVTRLEIVVRVSGPIDQEISMSRLMMTVEGRRKPVRVNASTDHPLMREQQQRIEAMIAPWRRFTAPPQARA
jgi:hypothetical protein